MTDTDLSTTIEPKSDQLNADDLISGDKTITVTKVSLLGGDQPVAIRYEGDNGKPYKPCKSMRRVLVTVWGSDGNNYAGRSMTLFRDNDVKWAGEKIGGIRISHMSNIVKPITMPLTASKAKRKAFTVKPLKNAPEPIVMLNEDEYLDVVADVQTSTTLDDLKALNVGQFKDKLTKDQASSLREIYAEQLEELKKQDQLKNNEEIPV